MVVAVLFGCAVLDCWAQVSGVNPTAAAPGGSSTSATGVGSGGLANTGPNRIYTTADLMALTNSLTGKTTAGPAGVLAPIQYLSPAEWAAVTNGIGPGDLAGLANLSPQGGAFSPAARAAIKAGLTTNNVLAIAATAAHVLAAQQAQGAGSPQPMTSMSGGITVNTHILNINFGGHTNDKVGPAAVGQNANDFWTGSYFPNQYDSIINNLLWSDQTPSGINLEISNAPGDWANGAADPMFSSYTYNPWQQDITVTLTGVPAGTYNLYLYGHGPTTDNSVFSVTTRATVLVPLDHPIGHRLAILDLDRRDTIRRLSRAERF